VIIMRKKCFCCAGVLFAVALVLSAIWHERHRWSWPATWISGFTTSLLGLLRLTNDYAAGLGVLITIAFGLLNWIEKRKITRATVEAAKAGTLHVSETEQ
jgi:predicted outer membrane lipoprotein